MYSRSCDRNLCPYLNGAALATGTPERVRGSSRQAANSVTVDTYAGKPVTVGLTDKTAYLKVEKSGLDKIEKGGFYRNRNEGCRRDAGSVRSGDFSASMRGTGEGHYASGIRSWTPHCPAALKTSSSMTNGSVTAARPPCRM